METVVDQARPNRARLWAGIIAVLAAGALLAQPLLGEFSYAKNLALMLRWFTIWGNVAACAIMARIALGGQVPASIMAALATALTVIASVYWALLSGDHHPVGYDRITNQFHHTIVPLATIAWWWRYTPKAAAIRPLIPVIMAPPLTYGAFALVLGQLTGFYGYFFTDLPALGWPMFLVNNVVLAVFFALLGAGLVALKHRFGGQL